MATEENVSSFGKMLSGFIFGILFVAAGFGVYSVFFAEEPPAPVSAPAPEIKVVRCKDCKGKGTAKCKDCKGTGKCLECKGKGYTEKTVTSTWRNAFEKEREYCNICNDHDGKCPQCEGTKKVPCPYCNGSGFVPDTTTEDDKS